MGAGQQPQHFPQLVAALLRPEDLRLVPVGDHPDGVLVRDELLRQGSGQDDAVLLGGQAPLTRLHVPVQIKDNPDVAGWLNVVLADEQFLLIRHGPAGRRAPVDAVQRIPGHVHAHGRGVRGGIHGAHVRAPGAAGDPARIDQRRQPRDGRVDHETLAVVVPHGGLKEAERIPHADLDRSQREHAPLRTEAALFPAREAPRSEAHCAARVVARQIGVIAHFCPGHRHPRVVVHHKALFENIPHLCPAVAPFPLDDQAARHDAHPHVADDQDGRQPPEDELGGRGGGENLQEHQPCHDDQRQVGPQAIGPRDHAHSLATAITKYSPFV